MLQTIARVRQAQQAQLDEEQQIKANVRRLREQLLKTGPRHFDMRFWLTHRGEHYSLDATLIDINACRTTGCIAGHAVLLGAPATKEQVASWLGTGTWLFYVDLWPAWAKRRALRDNRTRKSTYLAALDLLEAITNTPGINLDSWDVLETRSQS